MYSPPPPYSGILLTYLYLSKLPCSQAQPNLEKDSKKKKKTLQNEKKPKKNEKKKPNTLRFDKYIKNYKWSNKRNIFLVRTITEQI